MTAPRTLSAPRLGVAALLTSSLSLAVVPAALDAAPRAEAQTATLVARQGYSFFTSQSDSSEGHCTVSYNNPSQRTSFTAAHCGRAGETVYLKDAQGNRVPAGTFHPSSSYDGQLSNDWALIRWNADVEIGPNEFSGDRFVPLTELRQGAQICLRGGKSHGMTTNDFVCTKFSGSVNNTFFFEYANTAEGDSGGTVFVPGVGYVGVFSGETTFYGDSRPSLTLQRAVVPYDGPRVVDDAVIATMNARYPVPVEQVVASGAPDPVVSAPRVYAAPDQTMRSNRDALARAAESVAVLAQDAENAEDNVGAAGTVVDEGAVAPADQATATARGTRTEEASSRIESFFARVAQWFRAIPQQLSASSGETQSSEPSVRLTRDQASTLAMIVGAVALLVPLLANAMNPAPPA